ncbi:hypothetical protein V7124_04275 [Neobacillus niacini]|uniref:hypothetical protein n=1 Tax=Neobacillus niacini TaxID=86668 RepID=UPI002FFFDF12
MGKVIMAPLSFFIIIGIGIICFSALVDKFQAYTMGKPIVESEGLTNEYLVAKTLIKVVEQDSHLTIEWKNKTITIIVESLLEVIKAFDDIGGIIVGLFFDNVPDGINVGVGFIVFSILIIILSKKIRKILKLDFKWLFFDVQPNIFRGALAKIFLTTVLLFTIFEGSGLAMKVALFIYHDNKVTEETMKVMEYALEPKPKEEGILSSKKIYDVKKISIEKDMKLRKVGIENPPEITAKNLREIVFDVYSLEANSYDDKYLNRYAKELVEKFEQEKLASN